jgi:hypothetical protein
MSARLILLINKFQAGDAFSLKRFRLFRFMVQALNSIPTSHTHSIFPKVDLGVLQFILQTLVILSVYLSEILTSPPFQLFVYTLLTRRILGTYTTNTSSNMLVIQNETDSVAPEPAGSLPYLQEPAISPYLEPTGSTLYHPSQPA